MIVDTSALVAILRDEPDADRYVAALAAAVGPKISAGNYIEAGVIIDLNGDPVLSRHLDDLLSTSQIHVEPVTQQHAEIARRAYRDFGKGSGHPAQLNFGDCFAYALSRATGEPLLFKGDDFGHTELQSALG